MGHEDSVRDKMPKGRVNSKTHLGIQREQRPELYDQSQAAEGDHGPLRGARTARETPGPRALCGPRSHAPIVRLSCMGRAGKETSGVFYHLCFAYRYYKLA